jgi:hypothetical protein
MRTSIELSGFGFQIGDTILEGVPTSAEINSRIPIAARGRGYPRWEHFEMSPMVVVRLAALEVLKVCVTHYSHVALVRALNDNKISRVKVFTGMDEMHRSAPKFEADLDDMERFRITPAALSKACDQPF